jgi:hypothetical protein
MRVKVELTPNQVSYLMELVHADMHRMRELKEHGKSRGERNLVIDGLETCQATATTIMSAYREAEE